MGVIKSKMGTIGSKMGRKFEQKRKAKWVKKKENLVKAYLLLSMQARFDIGYLHSNPYFSNLNIVIT